MKKGYKPDYHMISLFLAQIIDNIDTLDSACRGNDRNFRKIVRGQIERAREIIGTVNGYEIVFHKNPISQYEVGNAKEEN